MNTVFRITATVFVAIIMCAVAGSADPIKVGVLLPSTGVYAGLGDDQKHGLEMGFDNFGRAVAGRTIKLIYADTESKPNIGLSQIKKLILRDQVDIVVGIISSAVAGAVRDFVHQAKIPLIISNAGNDHITGERCSPWILRTSFSNSQINREMGPWMVSHGFQNIFLLAFDYTAGHQMMNAFRYGFVAAGGTIIGEEYPPLGETKDFGPYLAKIKAVKPDATYVFLAGGPAIKFVKEWASFGLNEEIQLAGAGWLNSALYLDKQGDDAEGILGILNYVPSIENSENRDFQEQFQQRYDRVGSEFGVAAYDSARLIVSALQMTKGQTSDKKALVRAMLDTRFNGPRGPFQIDRRTNNVIQNIYVFQVQKQGNDMVAVVQDVILNVRDPSNGCQIQQNL